MSDGSILKLIKFKIDLIVWKWSMIDWVSAGESKFKIDLIVWKY